jgi:hypothetical protein
MVGLPVLKQCSSAKNYNSNKGIINIIVKEFIGWPFQHTLRRHGIKGRPTSVKNPRHTVSDMGLFHAFILLQTGLTIGAQVNEQRFYQDTRALAGLTIVRWHFVLDVG